MAEKKLAYRTNEDFFADDDPLAELARIVGLQPQGKPTAPSMRREPAFNIEEELMQELERFDTLPAEPAVVPHVANDVGVALTREVEHPAPTTSSFAELEPADLTGELEASIVQMPRAPSAGRSVQSSAANIRLPLANFNMAHREPVAPAAEPPVAVPPVLSLTEADQSLSKPSQLGFASEHDRHENLVEPELDLAGSVAGQPDLLPEFDIAAAARGEAVRVDAALVEPAYAEAEAKASFDIDELLADVSLYPVPERQPQKALPIASEEPVAIAATEEPVFEEEFEFDLGDIERELAELESVAAKLKAAAPADLPAPVVSVVKPAAPVEKSEPVQPPAAQPAPVQPAPVPPAIVAEQTTVADVVEEAAAPEDFEVSELPFDPSEITDHADRVEAVDEVNVPHLPPVEEPETIAVPPDYDFDIDAEMANLFGSEPESGKSTNAEDAAAIFNASTSARPAAPDDVMAKLDEFERALEEDLRNSTQQGMAASSAAKVRLNAGQTGVSRSGGFSYSALAAGVAAVAVLGLGIYVVYGWTTHGSVLGVGSGQPKIIMADTTPIKVVPDNPGGKVVPNQNKAVYDRVAGDPVTPPKQKELVSNDVQPMDVVQRTLVPENDALDDDNAGLDQGGSAATPVDDTKDARLLPANSGDANGSRQSDAPTVSPRRVKTMIVKPDGTLVAREDDEPEVQAPALASAQPPKAATKMVAQLGDTDAASAESTPIRVVKTHALTENKAAAVSSASKTGESLGASANGSAAAKAVPAVAKPVAAPHEVASINPKAASAVAPAGSYVVQIASLPTEEDAKRSQARLSAKFASVIGNHPVEVRKAEIAGKGTFYRVRVVAGTKDAAADLCVKYRAAGGSCLISR